MEDQIDFIVWSNKRQNLRRKFQELCIILLELKAKHVWSAIQLYMYLTEVWNPSTYMYRKTLARILFSLLYHLLHLYENNPSEGCKILQKEVEIINTDTCTLILSCTFVNYQHM